ncbi:MAG: DUF4349 domain-containing protein [Propionibacterium sp.]|nr:DUF4349 domain-containing protein [Propionibacterium sp.]
MNTQSRSWLRVVSALFLTLMLAACSAGSSDMGGAPAMDGGAAPEMGRALPEEGGVTDEAGDGDRMVIRSKTLRLEVGSTSDAVGTIREVAGKHSGGVTGMQVATDTGEWIYHYDENGYPVGDGAALRGWVTVRVPTADFEAFVDEVSAIGTIKFQSEASDDVTQEHVDLSARLENLRAQEARLREFFEAADDVEDMLAIEKELGRVRGDIESLDAQVTFLERQAAMATVTVELVEPREVVRPDGESWGFVDAITDGVRGAAGVLTGIITFVIATAPIWIAALILFFPIRALVRRRRARAHELHEPREPMSPRTPPGDND